MSFGFKKLHTIFALGFLIVLSDRACCSVEKLSSSLSILKTKLGELSDVISKLKESYDPDKLLTQESWNFFFGETKQSMDKEQFADYKKNIKNGFATLAQKFDQETKNPGLAAYLLNKINKNEAYDFKLSWCPCRSAPPLLRANFLLLQLEDIIKNTDKEALFIHTEFAELGCAQVYYFVCGLLKQGYRKIHLNLIGETSQLNDNRDKLEEALNKEIEKLNISQKTVSLTIRSFAGVDWNTQVKKALADNPALFACQSFAMVDPGDGFRINDVKDFYRLILMIQDKSSYKDPFIFVLMDGKIWKTQTPDHLVVFTYSKQVKFQNGIKDKDAIAEHMAEFADEKNAWLK